MGKKKKIKKVGKKVEVKKKRVGKKKCHQKVKKKSVCKKGYSVGGNQLPVTSY